MADEIKKIIARHVLDSRGNPTVEACVNTRHGFFSGIVASGASTGTYEALELRDKRKEFRGKGVRKAVENVNRKIAPIIEGRDCTGQEEIDRAMIELDGTKNKGVLGANAILSVSIAVCRAGAAAKGMPLYEYIADLSGRKGITLPVPQMNVMNGGKHADMEEDIQEQMIVPIGTKTYGKALEAGVETYHALEGILKKKFGAQGTLVGDEGGFVPQTSSAEEELDLINKAIEEAGYKDIISIAIDSASTEFFSDGKYRLYGKEYDSGELVDFYAGLVKAYGNIISLEDGMAEEDWEGWQELTRKLGGKVQIIGDDLLVTNPERISRAIGEKSCNALLLKINQIGTISESIEAARESREACWGVVVSHRSGETEDPFIADLVVGIDAGQSKFGAPARSERNAKYNELLRIEEKLGEKAVYLGRKALMQKRKD